MSRENVELAHGVVDAVARQDLALLIELTDPQVEWQSFFAQLQEGSIYRGHSGIRQYMQDLGETLELQLKIEDTLAVGAVVLVVAHLRFMGKGSGAEEESLAGYMLKVRRGRVVVMRAFREPEKVFEAVGLRE